RCAGRTRPDRRAGRRHRRVGQRRRAAAGGVTPPPEESRNPQTGAADERRPFSDFCFGISVFFAKLCLQAPATGHDPMRATITALAHHVPPDVIANDHFAPLGVTDEWIRARTGIRERRIARTGGASDLLVPAARACLDPAGL